MNQIDWLYRAPSGKLVTLKELEEEMFRNATRETLDIKIAEMQRIITRSAMASYPEDPT